MLLCLTLVNLVQQILGTLHCSKHCWIVCQLTMFVLWCVTACVALPPPIPFSTAPVTTCEFYEKSACSSPSGCNVTTNICRLAEPDKKTHCYAFWNVSMGHITIVMKGCWIDSFQSCDGPRCVASERVEQVNSTQYFCCCEGNMCNAEVHLSSGGELPPPVYLPQPTSMQALVLLSIF